MRNVLLMLVSLCISLDGFGKEETYYHSYTNFMPEYMCDDYGRLSTTVGHIREGVFLINKGLDIREMYYCGHFCDYIVNDSSLVYRHGIIYWEDEWELDSELKADTIIEVGKCDVIRNIIQEICNNRNVQHSDVVIGERYIEFLPYSEAIIKQLTECKELERELLYAYQKRADYRLSKHTVNDNAQIPFNLPTNHDAQKYLLEFSDVVSNMVYARLRELTNNSYYDFLILLENDGSIKKIISEKDIIVAKYNNKGCQFQVNQGKQEFDRHIIGNKKAGYCIYDKSGTMLFKIENIQNTKIHATTKWCHKADYCSIRENDTTLFYRNGILHYNDLSQINSGNLMSVTITKRRKLDIVMKMMKKLAKYLDVNSDNISLCDTVIQFKPEHFAKKLPASKRIEKELLLTFFSRAKNSSYHNCILLHNELNGVEKDFDMRCYRIYYSEFVDNIIYAEVRSQNLKKRLKVLFILDNRGNIEECITI